MISLCVLLRRKDYSKPL